MDQEKEQTKERLEIAKAYAKALQSGKSNLAYGINMKGKDNLKKYGLTDKDEDGVIDNYIAKFEEARLAAQNADKAVEEARKEYNKKTQALWKKYGGKVDKDGNVIKKATMTEEEEEAFKQEENNLKKQYEEAEKAAQKLWKKAEGINNTTKDYEDTMSQIREDDEKILEIQQQMENLAIEMYEDALDATDALKDLKDIMAEIKG